MCGIVAVFPKKNYKVSKSNLKKILDTLNHRGPDGEGIEISDWYSLAHKRLSIIDIKNSPQPFNSIDGRYSITYNGEIYNYLEIKSDLSRAGYKFKSSGDTEVIINAFDKWGIDSFNIFEGMFSFVLIDKHLNKAYAVRDQLGIKPLFYIETNEGTIFSSEVKAFLNIQPLNINQNKVYEQILYRYVAGEETIYEEVKRVKAGNYIEFCKEEKKIIKFEYYNHQKTLLEANNKIDYEKIETELNRSIIHHTRSDVGYNIQLSGGLDSSYITAILANSNSDIRTYSVGVDSTESEKIYQEYVSNRYKTNHFELMLDENDYVNGLEKATWHMDMPIIHGACVFLMLLSLYSKETSKVVLTGEGADELFLGYSRYIRSQLSKVSQALNNMNIPTNVIPNFWKFNSLKASLNQDLLKNACVIGDVKEIERAINTNTNQLKFLNEIKSKNLPFLTSLNYVDQTNYLQSLLERQDRMSMAASVETRVPFCNVKLFQILNQIKPSTKIKGKVQKKILKKLASKYFPKDFINRKKIGFTLPYSKWLNNDKGLGSFFDLISDDTFKNRGYFNDKIINPLIYEHRKNIRDNSKVLLRLIYFEIWHRKFIGPKGYLEPKNKLFEIIN